MPNADIIYSADLARQGCCGDNASTAASSTAGCDCQKGIYWMPPPPPPDFPPPYPPCPPYPPPCPPYPPCPCPDPEPKKKSVEGQICKLSKKAAVITKMIENLETKKKDVIIKIGDSSYNFGNIDLEVEGWDDGSYAATVQKILEKELALIKAKIAELAAEIGEEADQIAGTESTVAGDD